MTQKFTIKIATLKKTVQLTFLVYYRKNQIKIREGKGSWANARRNQTVPGASFGGVVWHEVSQQPWVAYAIAAHQGSSQGSGSPECLVEGQCHRHAVPACMTDLSHSDSNPSQSRLFTISHRVYMHYLLRLVAHA